MATTGKRKTTEPTQEEAEQEVATTAEDMQPATKKYGSISFRWSIFYFVKFNQIVKLDFFKKLVSFFLYFPVSYFFNNIFTRNHIFNRKPGRRTERFLFFDDVELGGKSNPGCRSKEDKAKEVEAEDEVDDVDQQWLSEVLEDEHLKSLAQEPVSDKNDTLKEYEAAFARIANRLMNEVAMVINGQPHR